MADPIHYTPTRVTFRGITAHIPPSTLPDWSAILRLAKPLRAACESNDEWDACLECVECALEGRTGTCTAHR